MLYLFVALKLPILAACYVIWWAVHQEPEYDDEPEGGGGKPRPHPAPTLPHAPRRRPSATRGFNRANRGTDWQTPRAWSPPSSLTARFAASWPKAASSSTRGTTASCSPRR